MLHVHFSQLRCNEETDEVGADEPYLLAAVVDQGNLVPVAGFPVPIPAFEVVKIGPFGDVDAGETHRPPTPTFLWGVGGKPAPLDDPDRVMMVVGLMENDNGNAESLRGIVKGIVGSSVFGSLSLDRPTRVAKLIADMNSAMGTPTGAPNFDDKVGAPQELRFSREELRRAEAGERVNKSMVFRGDGGQYTLTFGARNGVSLRSNNFPNHFMRHRNSLAEISGIGSDLDRKDATFRLVPGLADPSFVSFESVNFPNHFLRHQGFELKLHVRGGDELFRRDASFRMNPGLADGAGASFTSHNFPDRFLRHRNFRIHLDGSDSSELFRRDATFHLVDGLA